MGLGSPQMAADPAREEFDLTSVNTILANRFQSKRVGFTIVGFLVPSTLLITAVLFALQTPTTIWLTVGIEIWILLVANLGGAYGIGYGRRLMPGPTKLVLDEWGITLLFGDGSPRTYPWNGRRASFRVTSLTNHAAGLPDYRLYIPPGYKGLVPPYEAMLPAMPLTRDAFEALLGTVRKHGATIVSQPSSRFLGIEAPGTTQIFDLPLRPTVP